MRYSLNTDKMINRLVPYFLSGRKYILFLQSLCYPLLSLNKRFVAYAKEKRIEASMTSQVIYLEWYLNYKFRQYFEDKSESIRLEDTVSLGVDMYHENANGKPFTVWYHNEEVVVNKDEERPLPFYFKFEDNIVQRINFTILVPELSIPEKEFVYMLSYVVNTYKLAGKSYLIQIDNKEYTPNKK